MPESSLILPLVVLLDAMIGDPPHWPHMVRYMGAAISRLENWTRKDVTSPLGLRAAGVVITAILVGGTYFAVDWLISLAEWIFAPLAWIFALVISFQCLAAGQLCREARKVESLLLAGELSKARKQLSFIVGRETQSLDEPGIRRAVIETVAENLNDGVVAPLLYLALLGPAGAAAYKAVNTLDSMLGYKNPRYRDLGWAPARLDDLAGWLPARLTGILTVPAALICGLNVKSASRVMARDHSLHKSPNAGWPESAWAGALGIRMGGPNFYFGQVVEKPWLNREGVEPDARTLEDAIRLMWVVTILSAALFLGIRLAI